MFMDAEDAVDIMSSMLLRDDLVSRITEIKKMDAMSAVATYGGYGRGNSKAAILRNLSIRLEDVEAEIKRLRENARWVEVYPEPDPNFNPLKLIMGDQEEEI